ncbi:unnamed protein product [Brassica napus]|uniref:(rape) hypothetical protein n=1 Tax=Brassica napus TaxID=3708 RepID=A0A816JCS0_BRANA|nr:unnamed protein product [Brassica napus]
MEKKPKMLNMTCEYTPVLIVNNQGPTYHCLVLRPIRNIKIDYRRRPFPYLKPPSMNFLIGGTGMDMRSTAKPCRLYHQLLQTTTTHATMHLLKGTIEEEAKAKKINITRTLTFVLLQKHYNAGSDITRPWLYENYLSSTGTPVVNVTKATISAMNALSKFPRTNRMLSRNAKLLKRNIRLQACIQPFNNNKTVAVKHAEEHTSMRHHNSAAQGGVSNDCTPVFASGPHLITWFPHCYSRSILPLDTVRHAITSNAASNSCLQCICFQNLKLD